MPVITQEQGELPPADPAQYRVFIPEASNEKSIQEQDDQIPADFDPHVILEVERTTLYQGELLTIIGRPVQIGMPYYSLTVRDEGVQDEQPLASVSFNNEIAQGSGTSQILELVSIQADMTQVTCVVRAIGMGVTTVTIIATGEIYVGSSGPETIVGDGSGSVLISVAGR